MNTDLLSLTPSELTDLVRSLGQSAYRADQIYTALMQGKAIEEMNTLPKALRATLSEVSYSSLPRVFEKYVSAVDGTVKYLFELTDGNLVESVVMQYKHGSTICISTQVGCRMGCRFCASTLGGRVRDLTPGEMLGQIIAAQKDSGARISGVVMMGIGEPLDNYENSVKFLHLVNHEKGLNIGYRHISLSTCGIVPRIYDLAKENLPITLSISLHASNDETRGEIMPINHKYPIADLLAACLDYYRATGRRISFEYTLIRGKNDSIAGAGALADRLHAAFGHEMPLHVNLIPLNPVKERDLDRSGREAVDAFCALLNRRAIVATVRRKLGPDIDASCGQLRHRTLSSSS